VIQLTNGQSTPIQQTQQSKSSSTSTGSSVGLGLIIVGGVFVAMYYFRDKLPSQIHYPLDQMGMTLNNWWLSIFPTNGDGNGGGGGDDGGGNGTTGSILAQIDDYNTYDPIPNAYLYVKDSKGNKFWGYTDASGSLELKNMLPGAYYGWWKAVCYKDSFSETTPKYLGTLNVGTNLEANQSLKLNAAFQSTTEEKYEWKLDILSGYCEKYANYITGTVQGVGTAGNLCDEFNVKVIVYDANGNEFNLGTVGSKNHVPAPFRYAVNRKIKGVIFRGSDINRQAFCGKYNNSTFSTVYGAVGNVEWE